MSQILILRLDMYDIIKLWNNVRKVSTLINA